MILKPDSDGVYTVSFLVLPEYAMVCLLSAIETMRVANRFAGREVFRWQLLSTNGEPVNASNQLALLETKSIEDVPAPKNLFVCSSFNPKSYMSGNALAWLRSLYRRGAVIGAVDTGCYLLAAAGIIRNSRVTLHWEAIPAFLEEHPGVEVTNELFEIDHNLITCAGGTASIDLMLHIIQAELSQDLALAVCEQFIKSGIRQKSDKQRISLAFRLHVHDSRLLRVLALMETNLEIPLNPSELAEHAHLSIRQVERLFRRHLSTTPANYYLGLRLGRAQQLLRESHLSVSEIAIACGFNSSAHFSRAYSKANGLTPSQDRRDRFAVNQTQH